LSKITINYTLKYETRKIIHAKKSWNRDIGNMDTAPFNMFALLRGLKEKFVMLLM
jgi:hypothetical protein